MKYELRRDETLGDGLRRICRKQVQRALAIARGERETDDTPVHETRKCLKKARAALHLVKKEIGGGPCKRLDHSLRDVGRLTSEVRDAEVRLQTVRQLQGITQRQRRRTYPKVEEMLVLELQNFVAAFAEWQSQAIPILEKACHEIDHWLLDQLECAQLRRAVQQTYKCGRAALAQAKATCTAEDSHAFRMEAKQLWYQLRILRPVTPVVLKSLGDELHSIGDLLGRAHDLSFLGDRLRREHGRSEFEREGHELLTLIETSGSDLQRSAIELGERFYVERPRDFGARIADWLDDWAAGKEPSLAGELISSGAQGVAMV
jgi:CHAD domain-containing protein